VKVFAVLFVQSLLIDTHISNFGIVLQKIKLNYIEITNPMTLNLKKNPLLDLDKEQTQDSGWSVQIVLLL